MTTRTGKAGRIARSIGGVTLTVGMLLGAAVNAEASTGAQWERVSVGMARALATDEGGTVGSWRRCRIGVGDTSVVQCKRRGVWRTVLTS